MRGPSAHIPMHQGARCDGRYHSTRRERVSMASRHGYRGPPAQTPLGPGALWSAWRNVSCLRLVVGVQWRDSPPTLLTWLVGTLGTQGTLTHEKSAYV